MSRRKNRRPDGVAQQYYTNFMNNPNLDRMSINQRMYIRILSELAINRFEWVGLPPEVDRRFLELTLFRRALAVFYRDEDVNRYLVANATGTGPLNMYDNPTQFVLMRTPRPPLTLPGDKCVPIWGNFLRQPDWDIVLLYSDRLAQADRTVDINMRAMRHNQFIFADESERLTYQNVIRQTEEGEPYVFGTNGLDMSKIQAFNLGIDKDAVLNMLLARAKIWNECMTLLGINNGNQDKKERLVADEVSVNNEQVVAARGVALHSRQMAAEEINRRYQLNVSVGWNPQADSGPSIFEFKGY